MIEVKSKDGSIVRCELNEFYYNGTFMGECFISSTVKSPTPIDFSIGDYLEYRSEIFILNYTPAKQKAATSESHGEAFVYDNLKFNSLADELTRCRFLDYVSEDNKIHFSSLPIFSFYVSSARDLAERIQVNLDRVYTGAEKWTVTVDKDSISNDKNISVSNISCFEALALANNELALNFIIRGRTIKIGTSGLAVGKIFGYGKGNGLYDIEQTTNADSLIITRLRAYGSTRNLPYKYYNKLKDKNGNPLIPESQYVTNLMLPSFAENGGDAYIDSPNISKYGVREGCVYFDGSDTNLPEIYPSMNGMTAEDLRAAGISIDLDAGDNGKLDEVVSAEQMTDDGVLPEEGDKESPKPKPAFKITLKDIGFDISKNLGQETAIISMKSGMCAGREFEITGCVKVGNKYELTCNRFIDDGVGITYPNSSYQIKTGDSFVLLQIEMPGVYVKAAEQRLLTATKLYLPNNDESKYIYNPKIDEIFMARNPQLHDTLKEGDIFNFEDTDLDIDASVIIQSLVIHEGKSDIPTYDVTLNNERVQSTIDKIQNSVSGLMSNATGITLDQVKSIIPIIGLKYFLSKTGPESTPYLLSLLGGLAVGDNGSGISVLPDGKSQAVVDYLYVKVKAIFDELEVKKKTYVGGEQILSPAGMKCIRVEELTDFYRCFFKAEEDGIEIENQFTPGTFAISQECNIKVGVSHNVGNRYYWREVTAVGVDYIDLSKTKCDPNIENDIPAAGDDIVALGHDTDITRQGAIVLSSVNEVAPSIIMYQGIDSFSLDGKEAIGFDYDKSTGRARMRVYGDAYIGAKDRSSYVEYTDEDGVDIKGILHIENGSTGAGNLTDLPDEVQKAVDLGSVNLLRNSGFTGQYESEELSPDTVLSADSELYNSKLSKWTGIATVREDTEAVSGYSITLGSLSQNLKLIIGENYVVSYKGMGTNLAVSCGNYSVVQPLTAARTKYVHKFKFAGNPLFLISGTAVLCDLKLERGSIATDWMPSPLDNDKAMAEMQALSYIQDAIRDGSVDMIGGLMLANMIMTGSYKDGKMQKVTAGMSGIYNDDDDVAFWAGGTLEQAINAVMKYKDNPNYVPTEEELKGMANFVATHGGRAILNDVVVRGYIYALGGIFSGQVKIAGGKILLNEDGSGQLANGSIKWDKDGYPRFIGKISTGIAGQRIEIDPGDENGIGASIGIYDKDGNVLINIFGWDFNGYTSPRISMFDPKDKYKNSEYCLDHFVINEMIESGNFQTFIQAGRIYIAKNGEIIWDTNIR